MAVVPPAEGERPRHFVVVDPDYDDHRRLRSWDVAPCVCETPWRHAHGIR